MARRTLADAEHDIELLNSTIDYQDRIIKRCRESMRIIDTALMEHDVDGNADLSKLIKRIAELEDMLLSKPAGRKRHNDEWMVRYKEWMHLYCSGLSVKEVCAKMQIGRTTYYRFLNVYQDE